MSQRLLTTNWLWYLLALQAGSLWGPTSSITVHTPPSNPSTVEAQAKFFHVNLQLNVPVLSLACKSLSTYVDTVWAMANGERGHIEAFDLSPYKLEFGHVCEDPNTWEQRYESKDFKNHRDMGKVRWGDKKGGYGEHYWDLNHAGHGGNDRYDGDDGSYHEPSNTHSYDHNNNNSPNYADDEFDPEKSSYEESGRAKRAHPKVKIERKSQKAETYDEERPAPSKRNRKNKEQQAEATHQVEEYPEDDDEEEVEEEEEEVYEKPKPKPKRQQYRKRQEQNSPSKEKNQVVLVVSEKDDSENQPSQYVTKKQPNDQYVKKQTEQSHYVPYEGGAGVRQHQQPAIIPVKTVPRLFLEPSTGHVVDRATGQAYVLQPIAVNN